MVIVLFEQKLRADIDKAEFEQTLGRMVGLASKMPGFISIDGYTAADGGGLAVVRFESEESLKAWKFDPEHLRTQARGREAFFESYKITVATQVIRSYDFHHHG
jgi:heme-degrading monooxygenase HmoA